VREARVGTIVIGGGQAGLAAGYYLKRRGLPFVILDANERVGDSWRKRWDSLRLFTPARYDGLPGKPFPAPAWAYPTKDEVAAFLESYAEAFELPVVTGVRVERLGRAGDLFEAVQGERRWEADSVVVATGAYDAPRIPPFARDLDEGIVQMHSKEYRNPRQLQEGPTLVVGAANSGAEIAVELARHRRVTLSGRDTGQEPASAGTFRHRLIAPLFWFAANRVLTVRTPVGRRVRDHFLDPPRGLPLGRVRRADLDRAGIERVARVAGVQDGYPVLEDGTVVRAANVIWCTGFTANYDWIELPVTFRGGLPVARRGVVESCPGLYFLGLPFLHSLASVLVGGVGRDAAHLVDRIAHRLADNAARRAAPGRVAARS